MGWIPFKRFQPAPFAGLRQGGVQPAPFAGRQGGVQPAPFAKPRCALSAASQLFFAHKAALPQYIPIQ